MNGVNLTYPAEIAADSDGSWLVTFRDVPEAITSGSTKEEALAQAVDALETALEFYVGAKKDLPKASAGRKGEYVVWPSVEATMKLTLYQAMRDKGVSKAALARKLGWHPPQVDRALDLRHASRMDHVEDAIEALGLRLLVGVAE